MNDGPPGRPAPQTEGRSRRDLAADQQFWQLYRQGRRPELGPFLAARPYLPSAEVAAVIAIDQYERWLGGERVAAEEYLALIPSDAGVVAAGCDVIYGELLLREQLGEEALLEEYVRRFPAHAEALARQWELHQALAADLPAGPTVLGPRPAALVSPALPGYEVLAELGRGGMGVVYKARQVSLDRVVALKVVPARGAGAAEALARAAREAQVLARLAHPHIVTVHDAGVTPEAFYLAMELIDGTDLHRLVEKEGPVSVALACEVLRQAALGLAHAHERGLVHRDIKPSNLLLALGPGGSVNLKVLDLGLARLMAPEPEGPAQATQVGAFLGTPDFIAPEQANDPRAADARSDLYSLGCTLFFALTGRAPFSGPTPLSKLMQHHLAGPPALAEHRPDAPPALAALLARLLAKQPADRPQSAAEVAEAAGGCLPALAPSALLRGQTAPPAAPVEVRRLAPGARLVGHSDWVKSVAFTADGGHVASAGLDRTVRLWDVAGGREVWRGVGAQGGLLAVAAAPSGARLISGGEDREVLCWAPNAAGPIWRGVGHGHNVNAVAFTPDGRQVVSGSHDGTLRVWSADDGRALRWWSAHAGAVWSVAVAPGGRLVLSAGQDRTVRLWDVTTGEAVGALPELPAALSAVAVTPDGRTALVAGADGVVRLWDLRSLSESHVLEGHTARVTAVSVAPDGCHVISASRDQTLRLWSLDEGRSEVVTGHSHWVTSVTVSPDGTHVCSGSGDRVVCLWRVTG